MQQSIVNIVCECNVTRCPWKRVQRLKKNRKIVTLILIFEEKRKKTN